MPLASAIASSSDSTGTMGATGPKVSSRSRSVSSRRARHDHRRREEVTRRLPAVTAADEDLRTGADRGDLVDDLLALRGGDHRADIGADFERVAEDQALGVGDEGRDVVVVDVLHHVEALRRGADLPGIEERGPSAAARGDLQRLRARHVGADDEGSLPPISRLTLASREAHAEATRLPVATEPVKATQSMPIVLADRGADLARPGDEVDDSGRQVVEAAGELQRRQRGDLGGLADHRVAGGEGRSDLPDQQQQRVVPGGRCSRLRPSAP